MVVPRCWSIDSEDLLICEIVRRRMAAAQGGKREEGEDRGTHDVLTLAARGRAPAR